MALEEYHSKRDFYTTPEPSQDTTPDDTQVLHFVIQKHQATHLHYDLRLELDGVLKSWAVPKGPSLDPAQKKLAMLVEDHPFEYRNFEGIIPKGNYGAGTVQIWDEGTYYVPGIQGKEKNQQELRKALAKGNLYIAFEGKKVRGVFHLVRMHQSASKQHSWLLIKKEDQFTTEEDITSQDRSVRSGRTLEQIQNDSTIDNKNKHSIDITRFDLSGAIRSNFPPGPFRPMRAQLIDAPFDRSGWIFEIKWDGYRAIAEVHHESISLYSRNGISYRNDYPPIIDDLKKIGFEALFDGEIVVIDEEGKADFGRLQNYRRTKQGIIQFYVFDLPYLEGYDLRQMPLIKRKSILREILPELNYVKYSDHIEEQGIAFFRLAQELQIEGIMAKEESSVYLEGVRTHHWQKIKIHYSQEVVVGGFTEPRGGRTGFGALIGGVYEKGKLVYVGSIGGGFSDDELSQVREKLSRHTIPASPFATPPMGEKSVTWVEPVFVCEVKFAEWTSEGLMRQPVFLGFREDLDPAQVSRELPVKPPQNSSARYAIPHDIDQYISVDGQVLKLTNMKKVYWPQDGITKEDTIDYYREIASVMLPHLIDRPESLHRFPDGIEGNHFFHKDMEDAPEWVKIAKIASDSQDSFIRYLLCQDEATLVYMVNLGAIEINPWNSRTGNLDFPDYMVIDLDPLDCPFEYVIDSALATHELFQRTDIPHYVKTSGATGMHIYVPLGARYTYEQTRQFATIICTIVNNTLPTITSLQRLPERRKGKVYLDFLQNTKGKTMAAPYSLRPHKGAPVSTPLLWDEVRHGIYPHDFTLREIPHRLERYGDLWKPVLGKGIDMKRCLDSVIDHFGEDTGKEQK